ncbi:MAG: NlpC/P60 family protein [Cyclobacteriaceae bacterium]
MEVSFGVCRLSVVSVRKEQSQQSLQVTQLLFGDHYEVLAESSDRQWLHIRLYFDHTEGWIERKQHHEIAKEYFEQINAVDFKITTDICSTILYKKTPLSILMGSIVPISQSELFKMEEQFAFNGESKSVGQKREFEFLKMIALKYLNAPEQEGGKTPFGIDGSGLAQMVFKIGGHGVVRGAEELLKHGSKVSDLNAAKQGDVVIIQSRKEKINKIGLLLAENKIIHVDGWVRIDQLMEDGVLDLETKIYTHTIHSIARILND